MSLPYDVTPGPWKYALAFQNNASNYYAVTNGKWGAPAVAQCYGKEEDARLIAAAPELFAALEKSVQYIEQLAGMVNTLKPKGVHAEDFTDFARAAIAKAKGRTL